MIVRRLRPVRPPNFELEVIEKRLKRLWLELVYAPLLQDENLPETILNAIPEYPGLFAALSKGKITFNRGVFSGKFNADISRELKSLGAWWDFGEKTYHLNSDKLPANLQSAINHSQARFAQKLDKLDVKLVQILNKDVWKNFLLSDLFDKSIFRMDKEFRKNVETITIQPKVTDFQAKQISGEWQNNLERDIKKFTQKQIQELREKIKESYFKGDRYGSLVGEIQKSYRVTERKAEFLARNETKRLSAIYQGARYIEAGIPGYHWKAVVGTAAHPTRHRHTELSRMSDKGNIFYWNNPPRTTEDGKPKRFNNPGEDYNCRCTALPVYEGKR